MKFHITADSLFLNIKLFSRFKDWLPYGALGKDLSLLQLSRFIFVGILNTVVGYGAFLLFLVYTNYLISLIIAHTIGVLHSFVWNKYWTFRSDKLRLDEFIKFNLVYVGYLVVNAVILIYFVNILGLDPRIGQLIALPILTVVSFAGHKHWSFAEGKNESS